MHWIDPECLPETRGTVTQFLLNPHGEVDGFILGRDQQVHFPPHLSRAVTKAIHPGDKVRVRGVKPRGVAMVAAVQLTAATGVTILDEGPHAGGAKHEKPHVEKRPMRASGEVKLSLYGPKGELRGALLMDGTSVRMPPHAAEELAAYLTPRVHIQVWGHGVKNRFGRTIEVDDIAELVDAGTSAALAELAELAE
ncbi:hypothetical protein [Paraburkholderia sp. DHOC27]|uniref:hypothetical protein n=1 Tax=Paraburkholderia sp. DHOC27 TaxID=2303330 RepID=UPI000E3CEE07|nr:hypothetical protein [Paraburkholderia sp. DHOC27]RFU47926.1 hypothetical protein D0B32_10380 [Paraburkholderia sp. DHOC27]